MLTLPLAPHLLIHQPVHHGVAVDQLHHHPVQRAHQRLGAAPGSCYLTQHGAVEVEQVGGWGAVGQGRGAGTFEVEGCVQGCMIRVLALGVRIPSAIPLPA